mmetsp:Transcript_22939/g.32325  ORF Transcript_22939/g.32325 Transcript_22939/m.32325 type:complete len:626 (+) Transcript_22939:91-1968(+)
MMRATTHDEFSYPPHTFRGSPQKITESGDDQSVNTAPVTPDSSVYSVSSCISNSIENGGHTEVEVELTDHDHNIINTEMTNETTDSIHGTLFSKTCVDDMTLLEQTEKSLQVLSETFTHLDCNGFYNGLDHTSQGNNELSDKLRTAYTPNDFHSALTLHGMHCCPDKSLFDPCFNSLCLSFDGETDQMSERKKVVRNRASEGWRARGRRISKLRQDQSTSSSNFSLVQSSKSTIVDRLEFGEIQQPIIKTRSVDGMISPSSEYKNEDPLAPFFSHAVSNPTMAEEKNPNPLSYVIGNCIDQKDINTRKMIRNYSSRDHFDLCYDSDPGPTMIQITNGKLSKKGHERCASVSDFQSQNVTPFKTRRKMHYDSLFQDDDDDDDFEHGYRSVGVWRTQHKENQSDIASNVCQNLESMDNVCRTLSGRENDEAHKSHIYDKVQEILNETWVLTWHPEVPRNACDNLKDTREGYNEFNDISRTTPNQNSSPRCVSLWFERGNRLRQSEIVEPKLMWRDVYHPDLASRKKLNLSSTQCPYSVCLLSVCRIIETSVQELDRKKYPLAKKSCSFIIRTCEDQEFLFQAQDENERDRIVYMWKLVVARLASQAVVGNGEGMLDEFFVPLSFSVP